MIQTHTEKALKRFIMLWTLKISPRSSSSKRIHILKQSRFNLSFLILVTPGVRNLADTRVCLILKIYIHISLILSLNATHTKPKLLVLLVFFVNTAWICTIISPFQNKPEHNVNWIWHLFCLLMKMWFPWRWIIGIPRLTTRRTATQQPQTLHCSLAFTEVRAKRHDPFMMKGSDGSTCWLSACPLPNAEAGSISEDRIFTQKLSKMRLKRKKAVC